MENSMHFLSVVESIFKQKLKFQEHEIVSANVLKASYKFDTWKIWLKNSGVTNTTDRYSNQNGEVFLAEREL